jgi:orotate phosphoribosyltransferase
MSVGAVLGANLGGTLIAASVAEELSCRAVIAAQSAGAYRLIDGFSVEGERVLVVDDITTTGQTAHDLIKLVRASGGVVAGVGLLATKGLVDLTLGVETEVLVAIPNMDAVEPADCQACREGRPTT